MYIEIDKDIYIYNPVDEHFVSARFLRADRETTAGSERFNTSRLWKINYGGQRRGFARTKTK